MKKKWIEEATENKGGLHKSLHVPMGKKIPEEMIEEAAKKPGKLGRQARLAKTLEKMRNKKK